MRLRLVSTLWSCSCVLVFALISSSGCSPSESSSTAAPQAAPPVTPQQALAGVGKQGQSLRDNTGVAQAITAGPATLLNFQQKAVLEIQIPQALQLFQASEGRYPKSHEEFMQKIVQANRLTLPELPAGAVYRFNTEKGQLWVYPEDQAPSAGVP